MAADRFTMIPHWLLDELDLSPVELAVYVALLRFRDPKTGKCFPGFSTLADRASISAKSVQRTIPLLEARGMIRVKRRKSLTTNQSNVYTVALPVDSAKFSSAKARDKKSARTDRKSAGVSFSTGDTPAPTDNLSLPTDNLSTGVRTKSPYKKTHPKNTHQEDVTPNFASEVGRDLSSDWAIPSSELFTDETHESRATAAQISYLTDLVLHLHHEQPSEENLSRWRRLTPEQADQAIRGYKKALGRPDEILYPEHGSEAFGLLSPAGQAFAETAGMPGSVS